MLRERILRGFWLGNKGHDAWRPSNGSETQSVGCMKKKSLMPSGGYPSNGCGHAIGDTVRPFWLAEECSRSLTASPVCRDTPISLNNG